MTKTKKNIIIGVSVILGVMVVVTAIVFAFISWNSVILKGFETVFELSVKGESIEVLDTQSVYGKLNGNGNGINYFSAVLVKADEDEVKALVETLDDKFEVATYYLQKGTEISTVHNAHARLEFDFPLEAGESYYTVYVYQSKIAGSNYADPRGH